MYNSINNFSLLDLFRSDEKVKVARNQRSAIKFIGDIIRKGDYDKSVVLNFKDASRLFIHADYLRDLSELKLDTSNVTDMSQMFQGSEYLVSAPKMDTRNVTNMSEMFRDCMSLVSVPQLHTSNVTNNESMFDGCTALEKLGYPIDDDEKMLEIISTTGINGKPYKG